MSPNNIQAANYLRTTQISNPPPPGRGRMKVAFVCNDTKTLFLFRREAITELIAVGYTVMIIAPFDDYSEYFISKGAQFFKLPLSRQGRNIYQDFYSYKRLLTIYRRLLPDIVFQYTIKINIYGSIAAKHLGIPCVSIVPGLGHFPDEKNPVFKYFLTKGYEKAARSSSEIWFLNSHDYGFFGARGWLNETDSRILPGEGFNTEKFNYSPPPINKSLQILFLGRLLVTKGARTFADTAKLAMQRNLNVNFKMYGFIDESHTHGISSEELNSWIEGGWLTYGGSTQEPDKIIEDSHIVVVPTKYREGLNRVIQEALALGRPVITTSVPGAGELIEHTRTGYIVPPNDPKAILDVIQLYLSTSSEEKQRMGKRGSASVTAKYDVRKVLPHYWDAITRHCPTG